MYDEQGGHFHFELLTEGVYALAVCTGHGGVLLGAIQDFLKSLTHIAEENVR